MNYYYLDSSNEHLPQETCFAGIRVHLLLYLLAGYNSKIKAQARADSSVKCAPIFLNIIVKFVLRRLTKYLRRTESMFS